MTKEIIIFLLKQELSTLLNLRDILENLTPSPNPSTE